MKRSLPNRRASSAISSFELTGEEEFVIRILTRQGDLHINALVVETDIPINRMISLLFELEMKGVVKALVGGVYHLLGY